MTTRAGSPAGDLPLVVFGPRSEAYDFGPGHPLTPRRFAPGIGLLTALGADEGPWLAPEPAPDDELMWCHLRSYVQIVRHFSANPYGFTEAGIGEDGDNPAFAGMHEAGAAVAGGSIRAMEAILRGDSLHAFHPGGGLHHAMAGRAHGFCIYDDPALAIARARADGLRVLYVDLDVHHGDGVQALHGADPAVLTLSFHESGRYLFPGTGFVDEVGEDVAAGTVVNVPLEPGCGEEAWLATVATLVPELAAAFGPDVVVSQHGCDTHAWDPLAHLRVTTTAMGRAARIVDAVAHRQAAGRWLATGGGGYGVYRVVPRAWAHVWLAAAHREAPQRLPGEWLDRWAGAAARHGETPLPESLDDRPNAGLAATPDQAEAEARSRLTASVTRTLAVPRLLREAADRGWWSADGSADSAASTLVAGPDDPPRHLAILGHLDAATFERLMLAPRVIPPLDAAAGHAIVLAALRESRGIRVTAAVDETRIVGLAVSVAAVDEPGAYDLLSLGVAPAARRAGLAGRLLATHARDMRPGEDAIRALITIAERDPVEPLPNSTRRAIAERLFTQAGFAAAGVPGAVARADPSATTWRLR